jgi:hypothetical protein
MFIFLKSTQEDGYLDTWHYVFGEREQILTPIMSNLTWPGLQEVVPARGF